MSTVRVDFTNTETGIVQVTYKKSQTTDTSSFYVDNGQIVPRTLEANVTYDFKFLLGRQEKSKSYVSLISNNNKINYLSDL